MKNRRLASRVLTLTLAWICLPSGVTAPARGQATRSTSDSLIIARGTMTAHDKPRQFTVMLAGGSSGWEIVLHSSNPVAADLDLYLYEARTRGVRGRPVCTSEGVDEIELCRIFPTAGGPITVEIVATSGDGSTGFILVRRRLRGPRMGETSVVAGDAQGLSRGAWISRDLRNSDSTLDLSSTGLRTGLLFDLAPADSNENRSWTAVVSAIDPRGVFVLRVFSEDGREAIPPSPVARGPYQDVTLPDSQFGSRRIFLLVGSAGGRIPQGFAVGVFPRDAPIPVPRAPEEWIASGVGNRAYSLQLEEGMTAIVKLEGVRGRLSVADSGAPAAKVASLFGLAQQIAWIGDQVGFSKHLLLGVVRRRALTINVQLADTLIYKRSEGWLLHIRASRTPPNYLVQLGPEDANTWREWWATSVAVLLDSVTSSGVRLIALRPPPELEPGAPTQSGPLSARSVQAPSVFLARIESKEGLHLAVCAADGRVLDIGGMSPIRWEWSPTLGQLYLVVFANPQDPQQRGGPFRLELTRSLIPPPK